jgi:hypothetical protein
MGNSSIQTLIEGKQVKEPLDWKNNSIKAFFGNDSPEAQIETDRFEYVLDGAKAIINHKDKGDIFEKLSAQQIYTQTDNVTGNVDSYVALDGYFDMSDGYEEVLPTWGDVERSNRVLVKFKQDDSVSNFLSQINGVSYGSLVQEGLINSGDYTTINTAIVKRANVLEVALLILTIFQLEQQIENIIKSIKESVQQVFALASTPPAGQIGAIILAVALLVLQLAYAVLLISLVVKLFVNFLELFLPPIVKNKGINFRVLLQKSCEKFGYTLESPIEELDFYYYLPSKPYSNETNILKNLIPKNVATKEGIPSTSDYGYLINEAWDLMKSLFNTKIALVGNVVQLRNANDPYWINQGDFKLHKTVNFPTKKYNTDELRQTRMMTFATDNDEWTTENFTGTSYEIKTVSTVNSVNNSIKGLERISIDLCLPNNKTKANPVEKLMIILARACDTLAKAIGQNSNFGSRVESNRINVLKVSLNDYQKPRIVPLINGQLPPNHRDLLSAKVLMKKYHFGKSFVKDGQLGQKVIYQDFSIPFVLSDLKKTLKNGTFTLPDGRKAEFIDIDYNFSKDTAQCSISVHEIYTNKLKEIDYEP